MSTIEPQPKRQKISDEISRKLDRIERHNQRIKPIPFNDLYELSEDIGNHICALRISDKELDDTTFSYFIDNLPNLSKLIIEKCENISHQILDILPNLPGLTALHVRDCSEILNNHQLYKFVKRQTQLSVLEIEEECKDENKSFTATKLSNESIFSNISINGSCAITDKKLNSIIKKLPNLTKLKIAGCLQITEKSISLLPNHPTLLQLEIKDCHSSIKNGIVNFQKGHDNPDQVNIFSVPSDIWKQIMSYLNMKAINNFVTNKSSYQIFAEERISRLDAGEIRFVRFEYLPPYFYDIIINKFTSLSKFSPHHDHGEHFYECLPFLTNLYDLDLSYCEINDSSLKYLKTLTRLTHLNLYKNNTKRKRNEIDFNNITDAGLRLIAHLTNLNKISDLFNVEKQTNLKYLSLAHNRIEDEALDSISSLKNLTKLNISDNPISIIGLKKLFSLTNLTMLNIVQTTAAGDALQIREFISLLSSHPSGFFVKL